MSPTTSSRTTLVAMALAVCTSLLAGCFVLTEGSNYGIGFETNRGNVVIYKKATDYLYAKGKKEGSSASRKILADAVPSALPISTRQRALICAISVALCLSSDQIGRTLVSWFKNDVRHRSDFWEALSYAGRNDRCFAWTFIPSRNLTHKGTGTAGCKTGELV